MVFHTACPILLNTVDISIKDSPVPKAFQIVSAPSRKLFKILTLSLPLHIYVYIMYMLCICIYITYTKIIPQDVYIMYMLCILYVYIYMSYTKDHSYRA